MFSISFRKHGANRKERHPFISILKIQPRFARFMFMSTALAGTSVLLSICGSTALSDRVFSGCFLIVACYTIFGSSYSVIVRVRVVLKRTVVGDRTFRQPKRKSLYESSEI